jgi:hypothetical protein
MTRERPPDRREAELVDFDHAGRRWTATVGRFANGRIAELFIDGPKEAPIVELAQESAIVASLALQSGCAFETLRHALAGRNAGPLGAALALIEGTAAPQLNGHLQRLSNPSVRRTEDTQEARVQTSEP